MLIFDTETEPFGPRQVTAPPFVAMGWCHDDGAVQITQDLDKARAVLAQAEANGELVVGHNVQFDIRVLDVPCPARCWDTMLANLLQRLATCDARDGRRGQDRAEFRGLADLVPGLKGKDDVRFSFKSGHPLTAEQREYLTGDVRATRELVQRQMRDGVPGGVAEVCLHTRASVALRLLSERGLPIDQFELGKLAVKYKAKKRELARQLAAANVLVEAHTGPRGGKYDDRRIMAAMRAHVERLCAAANFTPALTAGGETALDRAALQQFRADPLVAAWNDYSDVQKLLGYVEQWKEKSSIHPMYDVLLRTGRTSCYGPNLQQVPSRGWKAEMKQVFVAPPGRWYWELDYCQLELCCLAYLTQGKMLAAINGGHDLHRELGAVYFGKPAADVSKAERQLMKAANFGLPGGMGAKKFRLWICSNGLPDPGEDVAKELIAAWHATWPEMEAWLHDEDETPWERYWGGRISAERADPARWEAAWLEAEARLRGLQLPPPVARMVIDHTPHPLVARWLVRRRVVVDRGRVRCPVTYTESKNTRFQGLAANLTKDALARAVLDKGVAVHLFIHDSFLISTETAEWPEDVAHIMLEAARAWLPGVRAGVEIVGPGESWYECKQKEGKKIEITDI